MCDPVSLMVASTVAGVGGMLYQGEVQRQESKLQAQVATRNATLADMRAKDAIERGQLEEERVRREATLRKKAQIASFGAGNIDAGFGSPLDVILAASTAAEMDAAMVRASAEREAEDFQQQGFNFRTEASAARSRGKNARLGSIIGGVGVALDGGAGVFKYRAENS